jgi:hypothetical protein
MINSHDLAKALLAGPNRPVITEIVAGKGCEVVNSVILTKIIQHPTPDYWGSFLAAGQAAYDFTRGEPVEVIFIGHSPALSDPVNEGFIDTTPDYTLKPVTANSFPRVPYPIIRPLPSQEVAATV